MCVCIFYYIHRTHVYSFCVKNCASPVLPKSQFPIDTWAGHCGFRRRTTDAADALLAPPAPAATGKPAARAPHPGFSVTDRTVPQTVAPPVTLNATVHRRFSTRGKLPFHPSLSLSRAPGARTPGTSQCTRTSDWSMHRVHSGTFPVPDTRSRPPAAPVSTAAGSSRPPAPSA
ncbi:hypothetical protein SORBI_3005G046001 [Sorghum bicolor]|uniref:Uncharacterized protein n=1 Tax=Sorghum bicolor TaxID=4558 RepID=A0A1Z5RGW5_SORBI|nr:hypothetical protein SORBI_3005G046001 [Sorghum bicolor]